MSTFAQTKNPNVKSPSKLLVKSAPPKMFVGVRPPPVNAAVPVKLVTVLLKSVLGDKSDAEGRINLLERGDG